jgi:hypothetical protein
MTCAGSVRLSAGIPDSDNVYSREGTFAHAVAATCLEKENDAVVHVGKTKDKEFVVTADMARNIQVYLDVVREILFVEGGKLYIEHKVKFTDLIYGTADAIIVTGEAVHIIDLKFGAGLLVEVTDNEQLMIYALAALRTLELGNSRARVVLHIVQPRRVDGEGDAHRSVSYDLTTLRDFQHRVLAAEKETQDPNAELVPGDHCHWCPAKHGCTALSQRALAVVQDAFADDFEKPVAPPLLANIPPERIAKILKAADIAEAWIKAVRQHATELARRGGVPGIKLVAKLSNRKWISDDAAASALVQAGVDPYTDPEVVSPAQAEKLLGGKKKAASLVDPLTDRIVTGALLVADNDPRPALDAAEAFSELPASE